MTPRSQYLPLCSLQEKHFELLSYTRLQQDFCVSVSWVQVMFAPRVRAPVPRLVLALLAIPGVLSMTEPSCEVKGKSNSLLRGSACS